MYRVILLRRDGSWKTVEETSSRVLADREAESWRLDGYTAEVVFA